ncbi:flagellar motor protein MotD [Noviherbaspirillum pedocola]|uniref:Flagellar motor protein MotD n=1 Tax=Noviherbaspirillum pedocola TaxID=2801341 RepID=A0A934T1I4_9BURK|nr:flagellar motor protein MotD [Noviherbaspirillum pedocola]MBK4737009.1 flagellar motor protein MotD [Noviherbaspirillum pedocola]
MRRRRRGEDNDDHDSRERWVISYADFITLLFAFFVVMYAGSTINERKTQAVSGAIGSAFGKLPVINELPRDSIVPELPLLPRTMPYRSRVNENAVRREREQMSSMARDLLTALNPLAERGMVRVTQGQRGITVEINASMLFQPGEARLSPQAVNALFAVAAVLRNDGHAIQVEGHTDNAPIANALYASNWELSAVRAGSVVRLFVDSGIAPQRLVAIGHGDTRPIASNDTPEGRMRNRRVQLMVMSNLPEDAKAEGRP